MSEIQYLEINDVTRIIKVPTNLLLGVMEDKDVERVYFKCKKIVGDNVDLSKHQLYVKYVNALDNSGKNFDVKTPGIYHCEDVVDHGDYITFSWLLSGNVFKKGGFVAFSVLASDGETTRWNTFPAIGTVLITIPGGLQEVEERYPDIITQLLNRMDEVEAMATPEAMQGYVNTYLAAHPAEIDPELLDPKKCAPADVVGQLKQDLSDWSRLEGYELANLTPKLKLVKENAYASLADIGKPPYYGAYDGCNVYSLDIEADIYTSTEARMILPIDKNGNALAEQSNYATSFNNTELHANKLYISLANAKEAIKTFSISKGQQLRQFDKFPEHTGIPKLENDVKKLENDAIAVNTPINMHSIKRTGAFEKSGDNILLSDARTNLRKGIRLIFEANVVSGTDFEIGFSVSESNAGTLAHNRFVINSATIEYYEDMGQSEYSNSFSHKLSISKNVQVIFEYLANGTADICLLSNGEMFKQNIVFTMDSVAVPYVKSNGLVAKDCKFTFICTDVRKKIWCFGDSYFAYSTARWTYYLREHGYDNNVLLDGFPGMGSTNARASFGKLLKLGKPKIAVWFEGMNDGTDITDTEPNDNWKEERDNFIALCEENSVEPVFATIPNVPNINHRGKNKWIKESGYRYIDMCHAVGADVDENWYGNMLSDDKVHPTECGAKALFAQVLLDLPVVMIDNL